MDINLLSTFILVAKEGGFRNAAEKQFLTPSAISSRIRLLEAEIGTQLFERGKFGTHLTLSGERLMEHAEEMLAMWNRVRKDVMLPVQARKVLAIGATDTIWQSFLMDGLAHLQHLDASLALRMETGTAQSLTRELLEGTLDAVCLFDPPDLPVLHADAIGDITLMLVSTQANITLEQALTEHFVQVDWGKSDATHSKLHTPLLQNQAMTRTSAGWLGLQWLLQHGGSAYLPQKLVASHLRANILFAVANAPDFCRTVYLMHPIQGAQHHNADIQALSHHLKHSSQR